MIYGNKEISRSIQRSDVPVGYVGGTVTYRVPADVYFGSTQEEADNKAIQEINEKGQEYANAHGGLILAVWYNNEVCGKFVKDDCLSGKGSEEQICVDKGRYVSYVSQEDADNKAKAGLDAIGQGEANAVGSCCKDYLSVPYRGVFYKNDCPVGTSGKDGVTYELAAGAVVSFKSQVEADSEAYKKFMSEGQAAANDKGTCSVVYYNTVVGDWFERRCPFGYKSDKIYFSVKANRFRSWISVEDANSKAKEVLMMEGQEYADLNLECEKWIENIDQEDACYW